MKNILLHITDDDIPYLPRVKKLIAAKAKIHLTNARPQTITEMLLLARERECTSIATTYQPLLELLVKTKKKPTLDDYAGSVVQSSGAEFLFLNPLEHLVSTPTGEFLFSRYLRKFLEPESWFPIPEFNWKLFDPKDTDEVIDLASSCDFMSVDIETGPEEERIITCVGFSFVRLVDSTLHIYTTTIPMDSEYNYIVIKTICGLENAKVLQNGKYDNAYLLRYGISITNWIGDTLNLFHSWYSELPKRLDFLASFSLRKWQYWKNESDTSNLMEYYQYNAKDCFATACIWMALLREIPPYAMVNYLQEFPLVFPCLLSEMTGLARDQERAEKEEIKFNLSLHEQLLKLRKMVGNNNFNPSSSQQTVKLIEALGSGDIKGSGAIPRDKIAHRHPLNKRLMDAIESYREDRKLAGTYLRDKDPKDGRTKTWNGRVLYSLSPSGTDTGRLASKESAFWCGWNIQNIPRDREDISIRATIISDSGFYFGECDYAQNEARGTAYLSGDTKLITAVDDKTRDFHGINASSFFGLPYDKIVSSSWDEEEEEWVHKTLDKPVRQVSKNTNHGANYNIGAAVLLATMGIENVLRARALLKLPTKWTLVQVTQHLLNCFEATYPTLKGPWYDKVKADIASTKHLVGPTGWIRFCFGNPSLNKRDLNRYVAHPPQSLAAMILNKAYLKVFVEIALPNPTTFKLGPQIHDSILFQYKIGHIEHAYKVKECMDLITSVKDTFGIVRNLRVPVDLKGENNRWSDLKPLKKFKKSA